jgi:hypothetical protein
MRAHNGTEVRGALKNSWRAISFTIAYTIALLYKQASRWPYILRDIVTDVATRGFYDEHKRDLLVLRQPRLRFFRGADFAGRNSGGADLSLRRVDAQERATPGLDLSGVLAL